MKKFYILFLFSSLTFFGSAQSNVRLNNYWDSPFYINPAAINDQYATVFTMVAHNQWLSFPGAPSTLFASTTIFNEKLQTQFGLKVFADKIGYTSTVNIALSYAYAAKLSRNWKLYMGLAASFQNLSYDIDKVNTAIPGDITIQRNLVNEKNYNCDLGAQISGKSLTVGLSTQNLFSLFFVENELQNNTNFLYAMYRHRTKQTIDLQFGTCAIQYNKILQMEFDLTAFFKSYDGSELFQTGLFYRTRNEMGAILGFNLSKNMFASYSYDFNVGGISRSNLGTHELMLIYKLNKSANCIHCDN